MLSPSLTTAVFLPTFTKEIILKTLETGKFSSAETTRVKEVLKNSGPTDSFVHLGRHHWIFVINAINSSLREKNLAGQEVNDSEALFFKGVSQSIKDAIGPFSDN